MHSWKRIFLPIALTAVASVLAGFLFVETRRAAIAEHTLHETQLSALTEAEETMQSLTLSLEKLSISSDPAQSAALLHQAGEDASHVRHILASLPGDEEASAAVLTYLGDLSAWAAYHLPTLTGGTVLAEDAQSALTQHISATQRLLDELTLARRDALTGTPLPQTLSALPTDLPLSAHAPQGYQGLPAEEINSGTAMQLAKEFVGTSRVTGVSPAPDTSGALPAYGVTVQTSDVQLNLELTRRGGKVLLMSPETAGFPQRKTPEECERAAAEFLRNRGFAGMESTYYQIYDGLCVLTFVYVQNSVLIWPDRILAQVRMDTGEVVGLEARRYWRNHVPRKLTAPRLSVDEARSRLADDLSEQSVRLCLLPVDGRETLCWQFTVSRQGETYVIYLNADTGSEMLLEKVMQLEAGTTAA